MSTNTETRYPEPEEAKETGENTEAVKRLEEETARAREAIEAMKDGRGVLKLETPLRAAGEDIEELAYDFTAITGIEYADAMDADRRANPLANSSLTARQALQLFAAAAAKETKGVDSEDIVSRMGGTDAVVAVQLARIFFTASIRAGQKRISKKR